jgi:hypothetical protein
MVPRNPLLNLQAAVYPIGMLVISWLTCDGMSPRKLDKINPQTGAIPMDAELKRNARSIIEKIHQLRDSL